MLRVPDLRAFYLLQKVKCSVDRSNQIVEVCVWVAQVDHPLRPFFFVFLALLPLIPTSECPGKVIATRFSPTLLIANSPGAPPSRYPRFLAFLNIYAGLTNVFARPTVLLPAEHHRR